MVARYIMVFFIVGSLAFFITLALAQANYGTNDGALLPDPKYTPGAVLTTNKNTVCAHGYSASVRNVTSANHRRVYQEYGIVSNAGPCANVGCEVDHLISLELGGSNEVQNLWPQPYSHPGAHEKDRLENWLHAAVCKGDMSLVQAQTEIRTDWVKSFKATGGTSVQLEKKD